MANNIVTLNVTQQQAPTPSLLQQTGAFISQGATTLAAGTYSLLTQLSDLTPLISGAQPITSMTWASALVTVTATSPHGFTIGDTLLLTITGVAPTAYNGTLTVTVTSTTAFTYPLASNPGAVTTQGAFTVEDVAELNAMATEYFAQGTPVSGVYVLELGPGNGADGVTALSAYLATNPGFFYAFLTPRSWSAATGMPALAALYTSLTARLYFFLTGTYTTFTSLWTASNAKSVYWTIEAPSIPSTEFSAAAQFYNFLNSAPSTTNRMCQFAFRYQIATTAYPLKGNSANFALWKAAYLNWIGTGAEGGISNTISFWGRTLDGRDLSYWYEVDWMEINGELDLANEVINGSNNALAPLDYDQPGINRLLARLIATINRGISYGLLLGPANATAVPFATYVANSPSDYKIGTYNGLSAIIVPQRGFEAITLNMSVTDFPTQ